MLPMAALIAIELLARPPVTGFVVGYQVAKNGNLIIEQIPSGETVDRWTRMVTTQRFAGVATRSDGNGFLQIMLNGLQTGCPGAKLSYRRPAGKGAQMRVDCPRNPSTGLPETFFAKAIAGKSDMHVAQVAFRRLPSAEDAAWAERYLAGVTLKP
jgi:hypothetical protein